MEVYMPSDSADEFRSFIGKNAGYYITKFKKFESDRSDKIQVTWNWPAFFFGFWWFIYRRLYLSALFVFAINLMPFCTRLIFDISTSNILGIVFGLLLMIIWGASANYIYYKRAKKKIAEIENLYPITITRHAELARTGGVNRIAIVLPLTIAIIGIIAAIAIPQFMIYKMRSNCEIAKKDAKSAYTMAQAFYAKHQNDNLSDIHQLEEFGFKPSKNVKLQIINGGYYSMIISSKCFGCNKTYYVDNIGIVSESMPKSTIASASASAPAQVTNTGEPIVSSETHSNEYASIDDVQAVPYINERGRMIYREFLAHSGPRAFVVVKTGSSTIAYGGNDPLSAAMQSCRKQFYNECEPYAVNDKVVWKKSTGSPLPQPASVKSPDLTVSSWARTKSLNSNLPAPVYESSKLLVKVGDTLDHVRRAYHITTEPEPVTSSPPGKTGLRLENIGIWFIFDREGNVDTIRLESPFQGSISGIRIGDSSKKVLKILGEPDPKKPGRSTGHFYYSDHRLHLLFDNNDALKIIFLY
jgi:Tfp pilus assembly major pilin PilA